MNLNICLHTLETHSKITFTMSPDLSIDEFKRFSQTYLFHDRQDHSRAFYEIGPSFNWGAFNGNILFNHGKQVERTRIRHNLSTKSFLSTHKKDYR